MIIFIIEEQPHMVAFFCLNFDIEIATLGDNMTLNGNAWEEENIIEDRLSALIKENKFDCWLTVEFNQLINSHPEIELHVPYLSIEGRYPFVQAHEREHKESLIEAITRNNGFNKNQVVEAVNKAYEIILMRSKVEAVELMDLCDYVTLESLSYLYLTYPKQKGLLSYVNKLYHNKFNDYLGKIKTLFKENKPTSETVVLKDLKIKNHLDKIEREKQYQNEINKKPEFEVDEGNDSNKEYCVSQFYSSNECKKFIRFMIQNKSLSLDEAEELVQEICCRILKSKTRFIYFTKAYFYRTARSVLADKSRSNEEKLKKSGRWYRLDELEEEITYDSNITIDESLFFTNDERNIFDSEIKNGMSDYAQDYLVSGYNYSQIPREDGISISTLKRRVKNEKEKLVRKYKIN